MCFNYYELAAVTATPRHPEPRQTMERGAQTEVETRAGVSVCAFRSIAAKTDSGGKGGKATNSELHFPM